MTYASSSVVLRLNDGSPRAWSGGCRGGEGVLNVTHGRSRMTGGGYSFVDCLIHLTIIDHVSPSRRSGGNG